MLDNHSLRFYKTINGIDYYLFKPSFAHWYFQEWEGYKEDKRKQTLSHWLRMCLEYLEGGYQIFYASENDVLKGYSLVARGGRRLKCSSKNDIVIGPYYTAKQYRGSGIAKRMIGDVLNHTELKYENAYMYIKKNNTASMKVAEHNGAQCIGEASMKGFLRRLYITNRGMFYVMKWSREQHANG